MSCGQSNSFEITSKTLLKEKETWLRSKGIILNDKLQVIYVLKMIYQFGKK